MEKEVLPMSKDKYESPLASRYASAFMLHLFSPDMRLSLIHI